MQKLEMNPSFVYFLLECANNCACTDGHTTLCDPETGNCVCKPGYYGDRCQYTCDNGKWGQDCSQTCQCSGNVRINYFTKMYSKKLV